MVDDNWLDYVPLEIKDPVEDGDTEELLCFRKRGRGSMEHRVVPRVPLRASIQRMKLLDDPVSSGRHKGGRGRARILQDRARSSRPHGLHQKKQEKEAQKAQEEPTKEAPIEQRSEETKEELYNHQWKQEDFPNLGIEHTTEGSPKKKSKGGISSGQQRKKPNDVEMEEKSTEEKSEERILSDNLAADSMTVNSFDRMTVNSLQESAVGTDVVKQKVVRKKKFDFTKANQELLKEFPIAKRSGPKILSLTQQNIERFLRESDTESSCSSQDFTSHNSTQENLEDLPVYQRYAVTLDDIKKSKTSHVPPKVKGHLANLLEAMDNYCDTPDTDFENIQESGNPAVNPEPSSSKNIESVVSNASVVSDLSNLRSPSDSDIEIGNGGVENVDDNNICDNISETGDKCNKEDIEVKDSVQTSAMDIKENGHTSCTRDSYLEIETSRLTDNVKSSLTLVKTSQNNMEDGPENVVDGCEHKEDVFEGFQKVISKQSKRKRSPNGLQTTVNSTSTDQSVWRIYGRNALQVDGLPEKCELSELHGMVAGFGTIVDFQIRHISSGTSVRFKLNTADACEYAVQCLDDTDCLFPDSNCKLSCHQLHT